MMKNAVFFSKPHKLSILPAAARPRGLSSKDLLQRTWRLEFLKKHVPGVYIYIYIYPLEGFPIKGGMTFPNIYVIMYLAILLVTFLGWWEKWPFQGVKSDLQRSGMKRARLESPGFGVHFKRIPPPNRQISGCWLFFFRFCSGFKFRSLFVGVAFPKFVILKTSCGCCF